MTHWYFNECHIGAPLCLDLGSNPYLVLGSQASGLELMPFGPMVGSPDSSIHTDSNPLNLAFLDATTGHSSPMTNVTIQGGPSTFATTSSKVRWLTRHQVLMQEARDFIETTSGDIHTPSSSQPNPLSTNLSTRPFRNASSQVVTANHQTTSSRRTRNNYS